MSADPVDIDQQPPGLSLAETAAQGREPARSLLDQLKQKRRQQPAERRAKLTIPETGGVLVAVYRWLDPIEEGEEILKRNQHPGKSNAELTLHVAMDWIIAACDGIYVRDEDGELHDIDLDSKGFTCKYDARLAEAMDYDLGDKPAARAVVRAAFNENTGAIVDHFMRLDRWSRDTTTEADREFFGAGG
jgi:hypothetical protein